MSSSLFPSSRFSRIRASLPHLGLALTLAFSGLCVIGCADEPEVQEKTLRPVRFVEVQPMEDERSQTFAGVARAGEEVALSFRVSGSLSDLRVKLGQQVKRGDVLARLDPTDFELQVEQGAAGLAQAEAALRQAEASYDRARSLYENQNASKADLESARAAAESAEAQTRASLKNLDQVKRQLAYAELKAPIAGNIALVDAERNENIQAGQPVIVLTSSGHPEVRVSMPELLVGQVHEGMRTSIRFDALPGMTFNGEVDEVAAASLGGSTFEVTVKVNEGNPAIRSGMASDVTFYLGGGRGSRIVVPQLAVGEDSGGNFVYLLSSSGEGEGTVNRRTVEVGDIDTGGLEIRSGLEPGDKVVTAGVRRLTEGMAVKVMDMWQESSAAQAAGEGQ